MRKQQKILWARRGLFVLVILLAHLLQNTPGLTWSVAGVQPYYLLTLTVCLGLFEREISGAMFGAFCGLLWDTVTPMGDGYHALLFLLIGAGCGILANTILRNNLPTAMLLSTAAHVLYSVLYILFFVISQGVDSAGWLWLRYYLPAALLSVLLTPLFYLLVRGIERRTKIRL